MYATRTEHCSLDLGIWVFEMAQLVSEGSRAHEKGFAPYLKFLIGYTVENYCTHNLTTRVFLELDYFAVISNSCSVHSGSLCDG
jgi:hypothetical protein